jgi:proton-dependent oligopeptide transporter, POT family
MSSTPAITIPGQVAPGQASMSHPRPLYLLFTAEMWERFSYYGMRALLVLYLVNSLKFSRADALQLYGTYTSLVYLSPIIGGFLADKWLGKRRAVLIGGIVMAMGHFAMAFPELLTFALGLLVVGNGFFKPNISTLVGGLYGDNDPRRDGGFTIFYMGINLGAFLAPLVCGALGEKVGWHYGFAAAGVGMVLGTLVFALGQNMLGKLGFPPGRDVTEKSRLTPGDWSSVALMSVAMVGLVYAAIHTWNFADPEQFGITPFSACLYSLLAVALFVVVRHFMPHAKAAAGVEPLTTIEIHRIIAIIVMGVFVVFFWMGFEQAGGTMNLFADKQTDRMMLGWEIPASFFQALNPMLIFILGPFFSMFWLWLDTSRFKISIPAKLGFGMIVLGLGFIILAIAQSSAETSGPVGPQWLFFVYFFHTVGELCLSPVGLSMVTKLAPVRLVSLMMGIWFTANFVANYFAGILEHLLSGSGIPLYWFLVGSSIGAGVVLLLISPLIKKLMHGIS